MTDQVRRLYAAAAGIAVLFLTWAVVAAHPWSASATSGPDPRVVALHQRELRVRREAVWVQGVVRRRWVAYRVALHRRNKAIADARRRHQAALDAAHAAAARAASARAAAAAAAAAAPVAGSGYSGAPQVRIVTLPPITVTRTS